MEIDIEQLKKKIIYRSTYRGTKEMDSLLGSFVKKYIDSFNLSDLNNLSDMLDIDDVTLYNYNNNKIQTDEININRVILLFRDYVYEKK